MARKMREIQRGTGEHYIETQIENKVEGEGEEEESRKRNHPTPPCPIPPCLSNPSLPQETLPVGNRSG